MKEAHEEFETQYKKWINDRRESIRKQREKETKQRWDEIRSVFRDKETGTDYNSKPCIPERLLEVEDIDKFKGEQIGEILLNPRGKPDFV